MTLDLKSPERRARAAVAGDVLVDVAHEADVAVLRQEPRRAPNLAISAPASGIA
jgi:hypothetical protein